VIGNAQPSGEVLSFMSIVCDRVAETTDATRGNEPAASAACEDLERLLTMLDWSLLDFRRSILSASSTTVVAGEGVRFHHVRSGSVDVLGVAAEPIHLTAGDYLLLPRSGPHRIRAIDDAVVASGELGLASDPASPLAPPLLSNAAASLATALPDVLVAGGLFRREPHLSTLVDSLAREFGEARPGSLVMRSRIATIIASAAVRAWVENGCAPDQWLVTVRDPHIARAIAAMQSEPGNPWTVESLARIARASRSVFTERFRTLVGDSPTHYLTQLRMEHGKQLLDREQLSVAEAAGKLGYGSEAAFSRAFRRYVGASPAAWRKQTTVG
jgi:AraC-like DNA-binding protein